MNLAIASKKHFLFDLDGTLVNSNEFHGLAFREVLERSAPEFLPRFNYDAVKGRPTRDVFAGFGFVDEAQIAVLTAEKQNAYSSAITRNGLPLIPGARELLDFLSSMNRRLYIVSAGSRASVEEALAAARIRGYFAGVMTSDDVMRSKPDPEIYRRCLETHDLAPSECVAVEDSESGIAASTGAGIDSVMIASHPARSARYQDFPTLAEFHRHVVDAFRATRHA